MKKMKFNCDYMEGVHPRILERLVETNLEQTAGYGNDRIVCPQRKKFWKRASARTEKFTSWWVVRRLMQL